MRRLAALLVVLGAVIVSVAAVANWGYLGVEAPPPLPGSRLSVQGLDVAPGIRVLALVAVAGCVAAYAAPTWARRIVGLLIVGCGLGICSLALDGIRGDLTNYVGLLGGSASDGIDRTTWPWVALFGGVLVTASGLLVVLLGPRWADLPSDYQTPAAREPDTATQKGVWDAIDRGEDPTG